MSPPGMVTRLKELLFALLLSPAAYYGGTRGTVFFCGCLLIYVAWHVGRDFERQAKSNSGAG